MNAVEMRADPGWHHSNWMFVPEVRFRGDDGTWDCDEREFNEVSAALSGGGTVGRAYEAAAARRQDWSGVRAWFGDERAVEEVRVTESAAYQRITASEVRDVLGRYITPERRVAIIGMPRVKAATAGVKRVAAPGGK